MKFTRTVYSVLSKWLALVLVSGLLLAACSKEEVTNHQDTDDHAGDEAENVIQLSPQQVEEFGIETALAGPGPLPIELKLSGEVVIDPDRLAHIVPRFPGIVKEVRKRIGDKVKAGEVLAVIESNESLATYEVKSQIAGTVTDKHLTLGEVITDDSHAFTVADLSSVWVNLSVYQKDLPHIKLGQKVVISAGPDAPQATGTISYISPMVDEKTRTATARVVLPNPKGEWRPGLFVTGLVQVEQLKVDILVPRTALETFDNKTVVFLATDDGFAAQPVSLGRSNQTAVEIVAGLGAGQKYVVKNGFTLKAELEKESFRGGHAH